MTLEVTKCPSPLNAIEIDLQRNKSSDMKYYIFYTSELCIHYNRLHINIFRCTHRSKCTGSDLQGFIHSTLTMKTFTTYRKVTEECF